MYYVVCANWNSLEMCFGRYCSNVKWCAVLRFSAVDCVIIPISDHISYRHAAACLPARTRGARRSSWSCPSGTDRSETDICQSETSRRQIQQTIEWRHCVVGTGCPEIRHIPALDLAHAVLVLLPGLLGVVPRLERAGCKSKYSSISGLLPMDHKVEERWHVQSLTSRWDNYWLRCFGLVWVC